MRRAEVTSRPGSSAVPAAASGAEAGRALRAVHQLDGVDAPPTDALKRAYDRLMAKASHLSPELRHRFLFQIPENREIVDEATAAGLSIAAIHTDEAGDEIVDQPAESRQADR